MTASDLYLATPILQDGEAFLPDLGMGWLRSLRPLFCYGWRMRQKADS